MTLTQQLITVGILAAVTALTRFLPFAVFSSEKGELPAFIRYLGKALPAAIFGMLIVYCLRHTDVASGAHGVPELAAVAVTAALHLWKRKTLLSIAAGTACYMLLLQTDVFSLFG